MHTGGHAGGGGEVVGGESPDSRVLPHVHTGAHRALSVDEVLEGEAEVGHSRLVLSGPVQTLEWLDKPFAESDELSAEEGPLYQIVDSFEQQSSHFVGDASFPGAAAVIDLLQLLTDL